MIKFLVIITVVATIAFAVIKEGINYLEYPSLQTISYPADDRELIFYHRGSARRQATLFIRELDPRATPRRIATLNYADTEDANPRNAGAGEPLLGTLSWTRDGTALVAGGRPTRLDPEPPPIWIYDVGSHAMFALGQMVAGQRVEQRHLERILELKGGVDHPIVEWYEMGRREHYVFSWKAHHWDRLSSQPPTEPNESPTPPVTQTLPRPESPGPAPR